MNNLPLLPPLHAYPDDLRPSSTPEALGGAGGFSGSSFWRFRCPRGEFALRAWPAAGPDPARLLRIHRWIQECGDFPFLPTPCRTLDGGTFVSQAGRLWELTRWLPGEPSTFPPVRLEHVRLGFEAVARIHRRLEHLGSLGTSHGIAMRARELEDLVGRTHAEFDDALRRDASPPERELGAEWLALARRDAPSIRRETTRVARLETPLQPCLRDLRHPHLLYVGDDLTGLIDFGAMGVDSVAGDLARLIGDWFPGDRPTRAEALRVYESVRPLSPAEHALMFAFERCNALLVGAHWMRWRFLESRVFETPDAVVEGLKKSVERMRTMVG